MLTHNPTQHVRYGCFAVSAILAIIFYMYRRELDLCARLFKVSSKALTANWQLMPVATAFAIVVIVVKCGMLIMLFMAVLTSNVIPDPNYSTQYVPDSQHACTPQIRDSWYQFCVYGFFVITWFGFWALETRDYIVGDTIGAWYVNFDVWSWTIVIQFKIHSLHFSFLNFAPRDPHACRMLSW